MAERGRHYVTVAPRTVSAEPAQWAMVQDAVYERRTALNLTAKDVVDKAGPGLSLTVLSAIENARQTSYAERGIKSLCRALGWAPDSIDRILAGYEPIVEGHDESQPMTVEERLNRIEANLAEVRRLLLNQLDDTRPRAPQVDGPPARPARSPAPASGPSAGPGR